MTNGTYRVWGGDVEFKMELERETDGRWIAEVVGFPGMLAYGNTPQQARDRVMELLAEISNPGRSNS